MLEMLQDTIIGRGWPDVVNTGLLVLGPIAVVLAQWLTSRSTKKVVQSKLDLQAADVKTELQTQASDVKAELVLRSAHVDKTLGEIHDQVNGNVKDLKNDVASLQERLIAKERPAGSRRAGDA